MRRILHYWETFVVAAVILYGCLVREPHFRLPDVQGADKWAHILMYMALGGALMWDMVRDKIEAKWLFMAFVLPVLYGGLIEILQENFFYPRTGDWWDWLADIVGTLIGCVVAFVVARRWYGPRTQK